MEPAKIFVFLWGKEAMWWICKSWNLQSSRKSLCATAVVGFCTWNLQSSRKILCGYFSCRFLHMESAKQKTASVWLLQLYKQVYAHLSKVKNYSEHRMNSNWSLQDWWQEVQAHPWSGERGCWWSRPEISIDSVWSLWTLLLIYLRT